MTRVLPDFKKTMMLAGAVLVLSAGFAMADDQPGPSHITRDAVIKIVTDAGYTNPHDIDFDNDTTEGEWELEAFDSSGKKFDIEVNATTGKIIKTELDN